MEPQSAFAKRMYDERAPTYEDSWHPEYSQRMINIVSPQPGDRVLVLCCGTGLESFAAAQAVGPSGKIVGVDVSDGMLAVAVAKKEKDSELGARIRFLKHDVLDLESSTEFNAEMKAVGGAFDVVTCSTAFVLFKDPLSSIKRWRALLREGGKLVVDLPPENNLISDLIMQTVAADMGMPYPSNRLWIKNQDSFRGVLKDGGYELEKTEVVPTQAAEISTFYRADQANEQLERSTRISLADGAWSQDQIEQARKRFKEEWEKRAVDGKVESLDSLYLYIARKA